MKAVSKPRWRHHRAMALKSLALRAVTEGGSLWRALVGGEEDSSPMGSLPGGSSGATSEMLINGGIGSGAKSAARTDTADNSVRGVCGSGAKRRRYAGMLVCRQRRRYGHVSDGTSFTVTPSLFDDACSVRSAVRPVPTSRCEKSFRRTAMWAGGVEIARH